VAAGADEFHRRVSDDFCARWRTGKLRRAWIPNRFRRRPAEAHLLSIVRANAGRPVAVFGLDVGSLNFAALGTRIFVGAGRWPIASTRPQRCFPGCVLGRDTNNAFDASTADLEFVGRQVFLADVFERRWHRMMSWFRQGTRMHRRSLISPSVRDIVLHHSS